MQLGLHLFELRLVGLGRREAELGLDCVGEAEPEEPPGDEARADEGFGFGGEGGVLSFFLVWGSGVFAGEVRGRVVDGRGGVGV
jgi:hypothetical protein